MARKSGGKTTSQKHVDESEDDDVDDTGGNECDTSTEFEVESKGTSTGRTSARSSPTGGKVRNKVSAVAAAATTSASYNHNSTNNNNGSYNQAFFDSLEQEVGAGAAGTGGGPGGMGGAPNLESSYAFTAHDLNGIGVGMMMDEGVVGGGGGGGGENVHHTTHTKTTTATSAAAVAVLAMNNHMPFYGRQAELTVLQKAVERISLEWMENPSEVVWITGPTGVGKTTLMKQALEVPSNVPSIAATSSPSLSPSPLYKAFVCRGTCEQYSTATHPFRALQDCLNDLCWQLLANQQKILWKSRLEEALGGEGPLVCTICPTLCKVLDCPPMDRRSLQMFDANTTRRQDRLAFAVRDLLQAVSEFHPIVMVMDQIHHADYDSLKVLQDLLTTKPLQNFLLVGIHNSNLPQDHALTQLQEQLQTEGISTKTTHVRLQVFAMEEVEELLCRWLLLNNNNAENAPENEATSARIDEIQDLAELVFALTKGNCAWMVQLLRLWNDLKFITYNSTTFQWEWNRKKLKKEIKTSRDQGEETYKNLEGTLQARLQRLPKKIMFVVLVWAKLKLSSILLEDKDPFVIRIFQAASYHKAKKSDADVISTKEELEKMMLKACHWGILKKLHRPGYYKFASDTMRDVAATLLNPYGVAATVKKKSKEPAASSREALTMQLYLGTELSVMSSDAANKAAAAGGGGGGPGRVGIAGPPAAANGAGGRGPGGPPAAAAAGGPNPTLAAQQRERYKFMAVEQLYTCVGAMDDVEKGRLAKINLEAAEIAMGKSAFRTAIVYLERGVAAVDHTIRWQQRFYDVTLRTFLFLARMRLCCGRHAAAKAACDEIFENCASVKDRVYANQVLMIIYQQQGKYDVALQQLLQILQQMGEVFPKGDSVKDIIEREVQAVRKGVTARNNQQLLNPKKMTDKKTMDILMLLANLVEIGQQAANATKVPNRYSELATIRMMHLSLQGGFTRQYPLAFAMFGTMLVERDYIKEAHRLGQVTERIARQSDFYGGEAVALFHWNISHWRRTYKRNLEPVLRIYNAQVDAGNFWHAPFSIHIYIQYHLASGFDLSKLYDNMQLFQELYMDYDLDNEWQLLIPQQAVSNLLGQSATPMIFFGVTQLQQDAKIEEFERAGMTNAIQYLTLLRLYIAFFFQRLDLMQECLDELEDTKPTGVWIPWMIFWECYLLIQELAGSKGKKRKDLKDKIEHLRGRLIDWYNAGAPNPNAMTSILNAEYVIAKEAGKGLSAMKAQGLFNDAVEAAIKDGATHLEAFACERAGLHFGLTGVEGYCTDYLKQSHKAYDRCHFVAKVIDLESQYADKLRITKRRARPAASYINTNAQLQPSEKVIGGGPSEVKTPNLVKGLRKAGKVLKGGGVKKTSRKVKELFKKEKAEPAPWGWNSKNQIALEDESIDNAGPGGDTNEPDSRQQDGLTMSPSPKKGRSFFGMGKKKKKTEDNSAFEEDDHEDASPTASPTTPSSPSGFKSPSAPKSPRRPVSGLFGKAKPPLTEEDEEEQQQEAIDDMLESPKPRASRGLNAAELENAWELPMEAND